MVCGLKLYKMIEATSMQRAVDVVLLPDEEIMIKLIELINYSADSVIELDTHSYLPHISLAMGVMEDERLEDAANLLKRLSQRYKAISLTVSQVNSPTVANGKKISEAIVDANEQLTQLHLDIMEQFRPILTHDNVTTSMFVQEPMVDEISTTWVQHYYDKRQPTDFHPHVTLGQGAVKEPETPIQFSAYRLALCHLGSYCTCRKILSESNLSQ